MDRICSFLPMSCLVYYSQGIYFVVALLFVLVHDGRLHKEFQLCHKNDHKHEFR